VAGLVKFDPEPGQGRFRPQAVAHFMLPRYVAPSFVVDITAVADKKLEAIKCYKSQLYDPSSKEPETSLSNSEFLSRIESRQRYYGTLINVHHGEAFVVREALNIDDPVALLSRRMNMYS
jgi:LmbE family N-acetylglucosaminyl deacetylase